jgi:DNA-binding transcriptional regulator YiaG
MKEDLSYQVELIERVKKELGMSQSDIARKFEVGTSTVSNWIKKKVKIPTIAKIALELMLEREKDRKMLNFMETFSQHIVEMGRKN